MLNKAILLLGSNIDNPVNQLKIAVENLKLFKIEPVDLSSYYKTEPWGYNSNNFFINQTISVSTNLDAFNLLNTILEIETLMGRTRKNLNTYSDRIIDIDILFFNDEVHQTENLIIPHPRIAERKFVLLPLAELNSTWVHPILKITTAQMLLNCTDNLNVEPVEI